MASLYLSHIVDEARDALSKCEAAVDAAKHALSVAEIAKDRVNKILEAATQFEDLDRELDETRLGSVTPKSDTSFYHSCDSLDAIINQVEEESKTLDNMDDVSTRQIDDSMNNIDQVDSMEATALPVHDVNGNIQVSQVNPSGLGNSQNINSSKVSSAINKKTQPAATQAVAGPKCQRCGKERCDNGKNVFKIAKVVYGKEIDNFY